uniref:60S ribosomal protein L7a n=1 Tax=Palpitomonas bilix TaxID=652834 RepID=A0A7S3GHU0_9EUKA|mmetsp:Transcript_50136/g.129037  ORF Transcript_50136/g.129037 Transcript_50136/m.129037 type:complete len:219 (+) Transcript_50136:369-1025(+)|eukprot:CAMPEP_0113885588 /NCGR_PEP_ID=MMETSP0780_2-20120614/11006_1 /TAXON_ID=652834 /ORGANISM="Palpitomonas bilix" /LENGTH=218 /DNA_ID=CAMNT_0000873555 /DNA_START=309 /DNA_END=965 /DNA_ORIENTATION=- /assembly_acc=CAM_ASM_000599
MTRYVKWPRYVRLQRQKRVLAKRLKVPPTLNQFNQTLDKNTATQLFKLLHKYRPEDKTQKQARLEQDAKDKEQGRVPGASKKPVVLKFGINHITELVESLKAQLVVIAHDVDPIEIVVWLPALCRKMGVPYCIVKSKSRLGALVHQKTATAVAITDIKNEDKNEFAKLVEAVNANFTDKFEELRKKWGGGIMGIKAQHKIAAKERAIAAEAAKRQNLA